MSRGLFGIEITRRFVRYAYLEKRGRSHQLLKADQVKINLDPASRGCVSGPVLSILQNEKIKPHRIFVSLSLPETSIHQINVPKASREEAEEIIAGEIEKIPALANRAFDFIYQVFPINKEKDRILFGAVDEQLLEFIIDEIKKIKIPFRDIEIIPLNIASVVPPTADSSEQAVVIVQEHASYLSVVHKGQFNLVFKLSVGLDQLWAAASDPNKEHVVTNWIAEIRRVLKSYYVEYRRNPVSCCWLAGNVDGILGLSKLISADMGIPVEVLTTDRLARLNLKDEQFRNSGSVMALMGALFHISRGIKPKFAADHFFRHMKLRQYLIKTLVISGILMALTILGMGSFIQNTNSKTQGLAAQIEGLSTEIDHERRQAEQLFVRYQEYQSVRENLLAQASYVYNLNRVTWSQVLQVISKELPLDLALTSFDFKETGRAKIEGEAKKMDTVAGLMRTIDESSILEKSKFDYLKEKQLKDQSVFHFGIFANIKDLRGKLE